jgi:hypothetical protein
MVHNVNDLRQIQIHTAELLASELSSFDIEKFKLYKSPNIDQIVAELIQAGGYLLCS